MYNFGECRRVIDRSPIPQRAGERDGALYDRLKAVMEATGDAFELVFVDRWQQLTGLTSCLREIVTIDSRVVVVKLRRNFWADLSAGSRDLPTRKANS